MPLPSVIFLVNMTDCDGHAYPECFALTRELADAEVARLSTPEVRKLNRAPEGIYTYEVAEVPMLKAA